MNRLWVRLVLGFLLVAWLAIGAVALIVRASTESSFRHYLNRSAQTYFSTETIQALEDYYAQTGSWAGVEGLLPGPRGGGGEGAEGAGGGRGQGQGQGQGRGGALVMIADAEGTVQAATDATRVGTRLARETLEGATALYAGEQRVGWLAQETPGARALGTAETEFLSATTRSLILAALIAALAALVVGGALAWQLTRPLRALTQAAHTLAAGQLGQQVRATGSAEIIELSRAFNAMSRDLAEGEALRRRMAADIAHELRTPVSVLRGHLEAMLDGVFSLDAAHLAVAYDQTVHLARLVDDLRLLTRAEADQLPLERTLIAPGDLVRRAVTAFGPLALDAGLTLEHRVAEGLPAIEVDVDRMQQVLANLLANALRHTPAGGTIAITAGASPAGVRFAIANTGGTLSAEQAAHVFEPFWRAEEARERDKGGSGLGLAISQQLVRLHGGQIAVSAGADRTEFTIDLPTQGAIGLRPSSA